MATEERKPWEQQEGESDKAFHAFCAYRDMPKEIRSEDGSYLEWWDKRNKAGKTSQKRRPKRAHGTWKKWKRDNNWVKRAKEYDNYQDRIYFEKHAEEMAKLKVEAQKRRVQTYQLLQSVGLQGIQRAKVKEMTMTDAREKLSVFRGYVTDGSKGERLELGEATEITEQRTELSGAIEQKIEISQDDLVERIMARLGQKDHEP